MILSSASQAAQGAVFRHASVEEYAAFLRQYTSDYSYRQDLLHERNQFVQAYPDLREWFRAPLPERVQRRFGKCHGDYLLFLGLQGYVQFDWEWIIAQPRLFVWNMIERLGLQQGCSLLIEKAVSLGFGAHTSVVSLHWAVGRLFLRMGSPRVEDIHDTHLIEFAQALDDFAKRPDVALFYEALDHYREAAKQFLVRLDRLQTVLFHQGQIDAEPPKKRRSPLTPRMISKSRMKAVFDRYLAIRRLTDRPGTVQSFNLFIRRLITWLEQMYPDVNTFAEVTRDHLLEFAEALKLPKPPLSRGPLAVATQRNNLSKLSVFFSNVSRWNWDDVPKRPLLQNGDLPKLPQRVPRYIPQDELERLMEAIRQLECPYQRAALLIARWSGARRGEIRRLSVDCLDTYPDGTPRLRIPVGKTKRERLVPLNEEAAEAIRVLQTQREGERGLRDEQTGIITRYLFLQRGKLCSGKYLFEFSLEKACTAVGLVTTHNKPKVTPHRFRHTVGTQLAQRGARFRTIQKILGHESAAMSMVYVSLTDDDVRQDYQAVLGPGAILAGPGAELIRSGELAEPEIRWIQENYFKTELELGRCLRLPQEGPCECDLYLTCAKFITSPEYAPRLRRRRRVEQELVEDALKHGWQREMERHQCTIRRLEQLLTDLGESIEGPEATDE